MKHLLQPLLDWYLASLKAGGCALVALLMAIESSVIPLPSEVVIPPAAHLAWTEGIGCCGFHLDGWSGQAALVLAGALGSWAGASVMYWLSRLGGRPLVMRYGKYAFVPPEKVEHAEIWAARFGGFGVFASRLLPVVRHLIGIPAGIVRLNYARFSAYTLLGSAVWCAVLCWLGVNVGDQIDRGEMQRVTVWLVCFLAVVSALYYWFVHRPIRKARNDGKSNASL